MAEATVVSPSNCRIKRKNAYLRMKTCSPKFKTVLRQRYKERVDNSRTELLTRFRNTNYEQSCKSDNEEWSKLESKVPKSYVPEDALTNDKDFNLDEELLIEKHLKEELTQYENWLLQEYESLWNEEENDEVIIICPLCCWGYIKILDSSTNTIYCTCCFLTLTTQRSMVEIQNDIFSEVDKHNLNCSSNPSFVKVPADDTHSNLCIVCNICRYLHVII